MEGSFYRHIEDYLVDGEVPGFKKATKKAVLCLHFTGNVFLKKYFDGMAFLWNACETQFSEDLTMKYFNL